MKFLRSCLLVSYEEEEEEDKTRWVIGANIYCLGCQSSLIL